MDAAMDPLAKLKARRLGASCVRRCWPLDRRVGLTNSTLNRCAGPCSQPRRPLASAAIAHRRHDDYLRAFGGTPNSTEEVANVPLLFPLSSPTSHSLEQLCPTPRPGQACPAEAARFPLSADSRNLLCGSVDWGRLEACFGSADHAVYALDLRQRRKRTLFTKTAGHREWVAAVAHLPNGCIASGGLDARVIVWSAGVVACQELTGHAGPVSQLAAVPAAGGATFVSASYDKRLMTWSVAAAGRVQQQQVLLGHGAPILQLCVTGSHAASGDREGGLRLWDLAAGAPAGAVPNAHKGHSTALRWWVPGQQDNGTGGQPLLLSGGQDGCVCAWDLRTGQTAAQCAAHAGTGGAGAVGAIAVALSGCIVTAGADCTAKGLDPRMNLNAAWSRELPDFPYSMAVHDDTVFVGCGDGSIVEGACSGGGGGAWHSLSAGSCAVRTLHASHELLLAGCDDGTAVLLPRAASRTLGSHGV